MTPDERNMLNDLARKVAQTPAPPRDPEAEEIIRTQIGKRPDALYLMTQTVLIQNLALQRAQQQIQELQNRPAQGQVSSGSSWLGQQQSPSYGGGGGQQYSSPAAPQYATPVGGFGGGSSFLRGAAQTAAGVAAGTLAAEAIGSMFSHSGGGFFGGSGAGFMGGGMAPTEEIVNNYYDSPGGSSDYRGDDRGDNFADTSAAADDAGQYDDNSQLDDSGLDVDDGSGFDDNSGDSFV